MQKIEVILPVSEIRLLSTEFSSCDTNVWRHLYEVATTIPRSYNLPFRHINFIFPHHQPSPTIVATTRPSYTMISAGLHTHDRVIDAFTNAYNEMQELYDNDDLEEVYDRGQVLLADAASPRYHRMKALLLLSSIAFNLDEAQRYHAEADALWRIVRVQHALGRHSEVDTELSYCRKCLDELAEVLESQRAEKSGKRGKSA